MAKRKKSAESETPGAFALDLGALDFGPPKKPRGGGTDPDDYDDEDGGGAGAEPELPPISIDAFDLQTITGAIYMAEHCANAVRLRRASQQEVKAIIACGDLALKAQRLRWEMGRVRDPEEEPIGDEVPETADERIRRARSAGPMGVNAALQGEPPRRVL